MVVLDMRWTLLDYLQNPTLQHKDPQPRFPGFLATGPCEEPWKPLKLQLAFLLQ